MGTGVVYGPSGLFLEQARPPSLRQWPLDGEFMAIGRDPLSAVCIEDASISRHHADLIRHGLSWSIVDARSTNGTFVNDRRVNEAVLQVRDRIRLGQIEFVVGQSGLGLRDDQAQTVSLEAVRPPAGPAPADMRIIKPHAGTMHIAEQQHVYYVQQLQQRENFLREVAATKTKARWLAWTGFALFVVGFGTFAAADLSFIKSIIDATRSGGQPDPGISPFGKEIGGIPFGIIGWAAAALGVILLIVGIVLHVIATSRRRQAYRDFPVLTPSWPGNGPARRAP